MLIANPIYDTVFKHLLENQRAAKFFIGTLLGKPIFSISIRSPERTYIDPKDKGLMLKIDFIVEIETEDCKKQKVAIKMQKSDKIITDMSRFNRYMAHDYMSDTIPIISIYILWFSLPDIETAFQCISRGYYDFPDCYIVQVPRIQPRLKTPLDRLLSVFEQTSFIER